MKRYRVTYKGIDFMVKGNPVYEFGSKVLYDMEVRFVDSYFDISDIIKEDILAEIINKALEEEN